MLPIFCKHINAVYLLRILIIALTPSILSYSFIYCLSSIIFLKVVLKQKYSLIILKRYVFTIVLFWRNCPTETMTEYSKFIDELLKPKIQEKTVVLDLFAGCGGLSLGFEAAGFNTSLHLKHPLESINVIKAAELFL